MQSTASNNQSTTLSAEEIRASLLREAKIRSVTFHPKALRMLVSGLKDMHSFVSLDSDLFEKQIDAIFSYLKEGIEKVKRSENKAYAVVNEDLISEVLQSFSLVTGAGILASQRAENEGSAQNKERSIIKHVDCILVSEVPPFRYDSKEKKWIKTSICTSAQSDNSEGESVHPSTQLMESRFDLIFHRLLRHSLFQSIHVTDKVYYDNETLCDKFMLVSQLPRVFKSGDTAFVCGLLSKSYEGRFFIEDSFGRLPLEFCDESLSPRISSGGFLLNHAPVVVRAGWNGTSVVCYAIGLPPGETRDHTQQWLGHKLDLFGKRKAVHSMEQLLSKLSPSTETHTANHSESDPSAVCMFFSDFNLDDSFVVQTFRRLLRTIFAQGGCVLSTDTKRQFVQISPEKLIFVFCGNFLKDQNKNLTETKQYQSAFTKFGELLQTEFPEVAAHSLLYFVPGPQDMTARGKSAVFPLTHLPQTFTRNFQEIIPQAVFTTNPLRLRVFGKELIIFRDEASSRMRAENILPVQPIQDAVESGKPIPYFDQVTKTMIDSSHLYPYRRSKFPVYPSEDHALRLFPLPDALFLCDHSTGVRSTKSSYLECPCFNPGSFSTAKTFAIYHPVSGMYSLTNTSQI